MANKLLNVRMDQEMIEDLKKVCGELEISVTDAIKLFSNKLIKERALNFINEDKSTKEIIENMKNKSFLETILEESEFNYSPEEFDRMNEEISNIILEYYHNFRNFINKCVTPYSCLYSTYDEIIEKFKEEYSEEFKNKITEKITDFNKKNYKNNLDLYEQLNNDALELTEKKHLDIMNILRIENPKLYKELIDQYDSYTNYSK